MFMRKAKAFAIGPLRGGGLITNYNCPSACAHCLYACGPSRPADYLDRDTALGLFALARSRGCRRMHIGGGEPLLRPELLCEVLSAAREAGVAVEYVETNSAWFQGPQKAAETLAALKRAGLSCLLVSISPFHNQAVPFARVRGVLAACAAAGMEAFPWVAGLIPDLEAFDPGQTHGLDEYLARFGPDYLKRLPGRYWLHFGGRAAYTYAGVFEPEPLARLLQKSGPCADDLADTSHFHLDLYGNYVPGLCSGLAVAADDLDRPLDPERYPLVTALAGQGPAALLELARRSGFMPAPAYLNRCHLCLEARGHLWRTGQGGAELAPDGFYRSLHSK